MNLSSTVLESSGFPSLDGRAHTVHAQFTAVKVTGHLHRVSVRIVQVRQRATMGLSHLPDSKP